MELHLPQRLLAFSHPSSVNTCITGVNTNVATTGRHQICFGTSCDNGGHVAELRVLKALYLHRQIF